jgi:phospholipid/cholesterol/gamma-HCH transport system permease protein
MSAQAANRPSAPPGLTVRDTPAGRTAVLEGLWTLRGLRGALEPVRAMLERGTAAPSTVSWDLRAGELDTTGALVLWRAWGRRLPAGCRMTQRQRRLFDYWIQQGEAAAAAPARPSPRARLDRTVAALAAPARGAAQASADALQLLGNLLLDTLAVIRRPLAAPWRELSATIYVAGTRALPLTGLVGVMVGIVVAYLSALQLRAFGADQLIVDMLGYAVIRELGPLLGAIVVAGRSGSAMTAQIGVMRLAQELDAMTALGLSISRRLIWPRVAALTLVMPLVVLWTILMGLAGGIAATQVTLGLGLEYFLTAMPDRVPVTNLWIGLAKGLSFGVAVGLTAAYFGLRTKPNTRDLGLQTTRSVVVAITLVILIDAVFAIVLEEIGF